MTEMTTEERILTAIQLGGPSVDANAVLSKALRDAGVASVPTGPLQLRHFATGPLRWAVIEVAGQDVADLALTSLARQYGWRTAKVGPRTVRRITSSTMPPPGELDAAAPITNRPSSLRPRAAVTLSYLETGHTGRPLDVLILDADKARAMPIVDALAGHGLLVAHVAQMKNALEIAQGVGPSSTLVHASASAPDDIRQLTEALDRSGISGAVIRTYAEAGTSDERGSTPLSSVLRYASVDTLVSSILTLVGKRDEAAC